MSHDKGCCYTNISTVTYTYTDVLFSPLVQIEMLEKEFREEGRFKASMENRAIFAVKERYTDHLAIHSFSHLNKRHIFYTQGHGNCRMLLETQALLSTAGYLGVILEMYEHSTLCFHFFAEIHQ